MLTNTTHEVRRLQLLVANLGAERERLLDVLERINTYRGVTSAGTVRGVGGITRHVLAAYGRWP